MHSTRSLCFWSLGTQNESAYVQRVRRQTLENNDIVDAYNVPLHHSNPGSPNKLFINFNGEVIVGSKWNTNGGAGASGGYQTMTGAVFALLRLWE